MKDGSCDNERGASFPEAKPAPLLFLPPSSKYHLCDSAATWSQGALLPDAPLPPLATRANPLLAPPSAAHALPGPPGGPTAARFFLVQNLCKTWTVTEKVEIGVAPGTISEHCGQLFPYQG